MPDCKQGFTFERSLNERLAREHAETTYQDDLTQPLPNFRGDLVVAYVINDAMNQLVLSGLDRRALKGGAARRQKGTRTASTAQLPRENLVTGRFRSPDRTRSACEGNCATLSSCATACFTVQRSGLSGAGHFRCRAEFFIHERRLLSRCAKIAAIASVICPTPAALHGKAGF